jgi:hypothetical protein
MSYPNESDTCSTSPTDGQETCGKPTSDPRVSAAFPGRIVRAQDPVHVITIDHADALVGDW